MDETIYNKHYIKVNEVFLIVDAWSDGPFPDKDINGAICINEQGGYQFRFSPSGEENPILFDLDMIPLYKLVDGQVVRRAEEEVAADRATLPAPGPTDAQRLEAQVTYTAMMTDTLLEV